MNLAIIGCNGMGRIHAAAATAAGLRVTVCADKSRRAAASLAASHGAAVTTDVQGALKRHDVDIVLVATPTATHAPLVQAAAKAGKEIFCEKPFCRTPAECKRVMRTVQKAGVKLFVGHVVRYAQEFEAMKAQVAAGRIGEPGFVKLYRGGIFPGGPKSWYADFEQSGGVTFDCMIHDLDWLRYAFGEPDRIYCAALRRTKPLMDYAQATVRMKSGLIATLIGSWAHPAGFRVEVEICGSGGMIRYDSREAPLDAMSCTHGSGPGMIVPGSPVGKSPYQREWEDFVGWIEGRHKPRVMPEDGLRAVEMATAALRSSNTGQPVRL